MTSCAPILLGLTLLAQAPDDPLPAGAIARIGTTRLRHDKMVIGIAYSPDSKTVASSGWDNLIRLWDAKTGKQIRQFEGHQQAIYGVAFSPDGKLLVSNGQENTIRVWEVATGKQLRMLSGHQSAHSRFVFTPDGKYLLSGGADNKVHLWDPVKGTLLRSFTGHENKVSAVHVSPDGKVLASGGWDKTIRLWEVATTKELFKFGPLDGNLAGVHFSPDGKKLAASTYGGSVYLYDLETDKQLHQMRGHSGAVWPVVFAPDGKTVASGGADASIIFWDPATGQEKKKLLGHTEGVARLAFAPDGSTLASASHDNTVRLWNPKTGEELLPSVRHAGAVNVAVLSPDGKLLVTGGHDRVLRLWDAASGKPVGSLSGHANPVKSAVFMPDGKQLLSSANQEGIILWDLASRKEVRRYKTDASIAMTLSPDGKTIAAAAGIKLLRWDVATGEAKRDVECFRTNITKAVWSPDGRLIAVVGAGVEFFDVAAERWHKPGRGPSGDVHGLVFSPDSRLLLVRSDSGMLMVLETATGDQRLRLDGQHAAPATVRELAAPDGRFAVVSLDGLMRLGDMRTGQVLGERRGLEKTITSVVLSPDGSRLVTGLENRTALIWDVAELMKKKAEPPAGQALKTPDELWASLAGSNASEAHESIQALRTMPDAVIGLVRKRLWTEMPADPMRVAKLITQLDDRRFHKREQAMRELQAMGTAVEAALKKVAETDISLDAKRRIKTLLEGMGLIVPTQEQVFAVRMVEVLELIGTGEAKKLLGELANGQAETRVTEEAKLALARLKRH
jgi:WD40 repeat protein